MAFCRKCGTQLNANVKTFCPACGTPVAAAPAPSAQPVPTMPITSAVPSAVTPDTGQLSEKTEIKQQPDVITKDFEPQTSRFQISEKYGQSARVPGEAGRFCNYLKPRTLRSNSIAICRKKTSCIMHSLKKYFPR